MVIVWCFGAGTGGQLGNGALEDALVPVQASLPLLTCCQSASPTPSLQCQQLPDGHVDKSALEGLGERRGSEGGGASNPVPRQQPQEQLPRQELAQGVVQDEHFQQQACAHAVKLPGCLRVACGGNHAVVWWTWHQAHREHPGTPSECELGGKGPNTPFPGGVHAHIQQQPQQHQQAFMAVTWGHAVAGASLASSMDDPSSAPERHHHHILQLPGAGSSCPGVCPLHKCGAIDTAAAAAPPAGLSTIGGSSGCSAEATGCAVVDPATGTLLLRRPCPVHLTASDAWSSTSVAAREAHQMLESAQPQQQQMTGAQRQARLVGHATPGCAAGAQGEPSSEGGSRSVAHLPYGRGMPTAHVSVRQVACGWEHTVYLTAGGVVLAAGRGSRGQLGLGPHVVEAQQPVPLHLQLQVSSVQPSSATLQGAAAAEAAPLHVTSVAAGTWHTLVAVTVADGGRLGCGESTGSGGSSSSINKVGLQDGSAIATGGGNLDSRWSGAAAAEAHPAASPASPVGPMVGGGQQADGKLRVPSGSPQVCRRGSGRVVVLGCGSNRWHQLGQVGEREGQPDAKFDVATANVGAGEGAGPRPGPGRGAGHGGKSLWSLKEVPLEGSAAEAAAPATVVAGGEHSALLDAGGRLWLWGRGLGQELASAAAAASGVAWSAAPRITAAAAADLATCPDATDKAAHACAGQGSGRVPGLGPKRGSRQAGGRGSGTPVQVHVPVTTRSVPAAMAAMKTAQVLASDTKDNAGRAKSEGAAAAEAAGRDCTWSQVALGWHHALALDSAGRVWAWGDNRHGQLARPSAPPPPLPPPPPPAHLQPALHRPQREDGSPPLTACCRPDTGGKIGAVGPTDMLVSGGQQAQAPVQPGNEPQQQQQEAEEQGLEVQWVARSCLPLLVHLPGRATCVSAGSEHCAVALAPCAARSRGSVWTWGWGEHGQLGLGDTRDTWRPGEVRLPGCTGISNAGQAGTAEGEGSGGGVRGGGDGGTRGEESVGAAGDGSGGAAWAVACGAGFTVCYLAQALRFAT